MNPPHRFARRLPRAAPRTPEGEIDWGAVRSGVATAADATRRACRPGAAEARARLDERARQLARPPVRLRGQEELLDALLLVTAGERFALETRHVIRVCTVDSLTAVPGARSELAGLFNHHGKVLPALDLGRLLGLRSEPGRPARWLVVLGSARSELGLLAQAVLQVVSLERDSFAAPPATEPRRPFVTGVSGAACQLLDGDALLAERQPFEFQET